METLHRAFDPAIGLAAEVFAHQDNKNRQATGNQQQSPAPLMPVPSIGQLSEKDAKVLTPARSLSEPISDAVSDEEQWELDEKIDELGAASCDTQAPLPPRPSCVPKGKNGNPPAIKDIVDAFIAAYPVQPSSKTLPCSVIIPQKRPGTKARGFVRAYAPVLQDIGIDEVMWMDFMRSLEESIRVSPIFDAVNIAFQIVGIFGSAIPSNAARAALTAVTIADTAAKEIYQRSRCNGFLEQMNARFFAPLGLVALIMTFDPQCNEAIEPFNLDSTVAKAETTPTSTMAAKLKTLKGLTGMTQGEIQMPKAAELVFPAIDVPATDGKALSAWWVRSSAFVTSYRDRRAQAHWAAQNPSTTLAMVPQFESSLGNLGTERATLKEAKMQKREQKKSKKTTSLAPEEKKEPSLKHKNSKMNLLVTKVGGDKLQSQGAAMTAMVKRKLRPTVMYLMVTQRPTEEQLAFARQQLAMVQSQPLPQQAKPQSPYTKWFSRGI